MHRDIKPNNIFIREEDGKKEIKLGNFGCSLFIKDNNSEPIGTILYCAPEIIKNLEYDEKCDLWSLGVTLFELYFAFLPYGEYGDKVNINKIKKVIYDPKNFIFTKSNIPSLDILFKRLLVIDPKDRMTFDEFFDYVLNDNFMKEGVIYVNDNPKYKEVYKIIQNEPQIEEPLIFEGDYDYEYLQKRNMKNILSLIESDHLPDIMNFSNGEINNDGKYNNIIYYDENTENSSEKNQDSDFFEKKTPGAFFLCTNLDSLKLISKEIIRQNKKDKRIIFNIITTGSKCDKIMDFLNDNNNKEFKDCIKNVCIYCMNLKKWGHLKEKYPI
jgi:serine/threonine protein kinase